MFLPAIGKKIILPLVLILGINLLYPLATVLTEWPADAVWDRPAERLIRLHVIANSDDPTDQNLKYKVRDKIVEAMGPLLSPARDIQESRELTRRNLPLSPLWPRKRSRGKGLITRCVPRWDGSISRLVYTAICMYLRAITKRLKWLSEAVKAPTGGVFCFPRCALWGPPAGLHTSAVTDRTAAMFCFPLSLCRRTG